MIRRDRWLWFVFAAILVILFLASSTDLIIREHDDEIYPVSIILDSTDDEYYVNFKKGLDRAAMDYNVDANFITLYRDNSGTEQLDMIRSEIDEGSRAVILTPVNHKGIIEELKEISGNTPMVILRRELYDLEADGITIDYSEAGYDLAEHIIEEQDTSIPIYIVSSSYNSMDYDELSKALSEKLAGIGFKVIIYESMSSEDIIYNMLRAHIRVIKEKSIYIGLDKFSTTTLARLAEEEEDICDGMVGLYGLGSTTELLNKLDKGIVTGLEVWNEYDEGYMAMAKAVYAINTPGLKKIETLETTYITRDMLRSDKFMKMLYPIY